MIDLENSKLALHCLSCVTKPCQVGCPLNNDIPTFIKYIKENNYEKAFETLQETSVLTPICGRICPHFQQCQGSCVRRFSSEPVQIGKLEALVGDIALEKEWNIYSPKETKYNVAVIGSGPASLTCAAFLRRNGIKVTIYEKYDHLGGILSHGIPDFRLDPKIVKKVIERIIDLGIEVKYNIELGKDIKLEELKENYDAIFIGIGANISNQMNIPGENLKGVYGGNEVLERNIQVDYKGKTVIVSGGGNVAMDISRTAKRLGAKRVIVVYRRSEKEMPADKKEVEEAKNDGVEFIYQTNIVKILGQEKIERIEVVKTELIQKEGETRLLPINIEGSNYEISCDIIMMAIGSHPEEYVKDFNLEKNSQGKIKIDKDNHTSDKKVFSGGDVAGIKSTVAWASRSGRNAAYSIIKYLKSL
ncbi:MAG: NAD(P)-dependent oxidoreductase [Bacilli bacterium]|nr:NAD(P)-dependent oxidoreductase [Bacilli bacterium]